jgi:hypothetical protein
MKTKDYRRAAEELQWLRVTMLALHALRPPSEMEYADAARMLGNVATQLFWGYALGVPYTTTYEMLRQNRSIILNTK